jgi:hypothetical protein
MLCFSDSELAPHPEENFRCKRKRNDEYGSMRIAQIRWPLIM